VATKVIKGFQPIISTRVKILILGSMPSVTSLTKQQYYGHQGNAFWPIMEALFGIDPALTYAVRKSLLIQNNIAVWDVLKSCQRSGSLDHNIAMQSIQVNDFVSLFKQYGLLRYIYFNGAVAEKVYKKHVLPQVEEQFNYLQYQRLPSTSPAHAALNRQQKSAVWQVIKRNDDKVSM
jgi:hypoxanthine-DNA glycosylase